MFFSSVDSKKWLGRRNVTIAIDSVTSKEKRATEKKPGTSILRAAAAVDLGTVDYTLLLCVAVY